MMRREEPISVFPEQLLVNGLRLTVEANEVPSPPSLCPSPIQAHPQNPPPSQPDNRRRAGGTINAATANSHRVTINLTISIYSTTVTVITTMTSTCKINITVTCTITITGDIISADALTAITVVITSNSPITITITTDLYPVANIDTPASPPSNGPGT